MALGAVGRRLNYALDSAGPRGAVATARVGPLYSRRQISRVETHDDVWACWRCDGLEDVSRICDLSVGGCSSLQPVLGARARESSLIFLFRKDRSGSKQSCNM